MIVRETVKIIAIEITYRVIFMECMKKVNLALHDDFDIALAIKKTCRLAFFIAFETFSFVRLFDFVRNNKQTYAIVYVLESVYIQVYTHPNVCINIA